MEQEQITKNFEALREYMTNEIEMRQDIMARLSDLDEVVGKFKALEILSRRDRRDGVITGGTYNPLTESIDFTVESPGVDFSVNVSAIVPDGVALSGTYNPTTEAIDFIVAGPGSNFSVTLPPFGPSVTASNGLSIDGVSGDVQLGGALTQSTEIDAAGNAFYLNNISELEMTLEEGVIEVDSSMAIYSGGGMNVSAEGLLVLNGNDLQILAPDNLQIVAGPTGPGAPGQVLTSNGSLALWQDPAGGAGAINGVTDIAGSHGLGGSLIQDTLITGDGFYFNLLGADNVGLSTVGNASQLAINDILTRLQGDGPVRIQSNNGPLEMINFGTEGDLLIQNFSTGLDNSIVLESAGPIDHISPEVQFLNSVGGPAPFILNGPWDITGPTLNSINLSTSLDTTLSSSQVMSLNGGIANSIVLNDPINQAVTVSSPNGVVFPSWVTANRPAAPALSATGFNLDTNQMEYWNGVTWVAM